MTFFQVALHVQQCQQVEILLKFFLYLKKSGFFHTGVCCSRGHTYLFDIVIPVSKYGTLKKLLQTPLIMNTKRNMRLKD